MADTQSEFHFSRDIELSNLPLVEAWLEIRWKLEEIDPPQVMKDPGFLFALGPFFEQVKDQFPEREPLSAAEAPEQLFPHVVRYRFRSKDKASLVQIGPGVASVNFLEDYSKRVFLDKALFLRQALLNAYHGTDADLDTQAVILRYRNVELFDYKSKDLLGFLRDSLNTSITIPQYIPGHTSSNGLPSGIRLNLSFDLDTPQGVGSVQVVTGQKHDTEPNNGDSKNAVLWELGIASRDENAPKLTEEDKFADWLTSANRVIHEWFFSLIEGKLLQKYR